ncbi:MAG: prepilin-type N-terminal cleavage/methylation domain-containing protein [Lachnospiraceae bacterium]|nr:prepilin-type N-terminal cleavage/methylation domain-containing protein [Lachnospiraceae bacterium]
MKRENGMNNKGFSLVELIIVIAIMAILIGVMAPNMMRFVERTNVSADMQTLDSLRTAIMTAMADPMINEASQQSFNTNFSQAAPALLNATNLPATTTGISMAEDICRTLNIAPAVAGSATGGDIETAIRAQLRSHGTTNATTIQVHIVSGNVIIRLLGTDRTGGRSTGRTPGTASVTDIVVGTDADIYTAP